MLVSEASAGNQWKGFRFGRVKPKKKGQNLLYEYENLGLPQRITALIHRARKEVESFSPNPDHAETIEPTDVAISKLAQEIEMIGIMDKPQAEKRGSSALMKPDYHEGEQAAENFGSGSV